MTDTQNDSQGAGRFSAHTDDELISAIDQLGAEVSMGKRHMQNELSEAQQEAERRELRY